MHRTTRNVDPGFWFRPRNSEMNFETYARRRLSTFRLIQKRKSVTKGSGITNLEQPFGAISPGGHLVTMNSNTLRTTNKKLSSSFTQLSASGKRQISSSGTAADPGGPWGPGPALPPRFFSQNHAVFRQFYGKPPYFEQMLGSGPPLG